LRAYSEVHGGAFTPTWDSDIKQQYIYKTETTFRTVFTVLFEGLIKDSN